MFDNRTSSAAVYQGRRDSCLLEEGRRVADHQQKNWGAIGLIYILTVLAMAFVGTIVPWMDYMQRDLAATPEALGLAVALFSAPSAVLAGNGGGLGDRVGSRTGLLVGGLLSTIA